MQFCCGQFGTGDSHTPFRQNPLSVQATRSSQGVPFGVPGTLHKSSAPLPAPSKKSTAVSIATGSPVHGALRSALVKLFMNWSSAFPRHTEPTGPPLTSAVARQPSFALTFSAVAFHLLASHLLGPGSGS